jgi:hypothetical protein
MKAKMITILVDDKFDDITWSARNISGVSQHIPCLDYMVENVEVDGDCVGKELGSFFDWDIQLEKRR